MKKAMELAASRNVRDLEELASSEVCFVSLLGVKSLRFVSICSYFVSVCLCLFDRLKILCLFGTMTKLLEMITRKESCLHLMSKSRGAMEMKQK